MEIDITSHNNNRKILKLKAQTKKRDVQTFINGLEGHILRTYNNLPYMVVDVKDNQMRALGDNDLIEEMYEDGRVKICEQEIPWGISKIEAQAMHAKYGIKGFGVKVAVIDSGVDLNHPDLMVYGGKSFVSPTYQDDHGHGTHVSGTIAALDNGEGVIGVAPEAQIYALKVLDASGSGYWSDVVAAIEWCIENKMDIISMSLGGSQGSPLLETAIAQAYQAGILIIAAAGNEGNGDGIGDTVGYPARYPEAIAVAATDVDNKRGYFSSTGSKVELAAPGVNVVSTVLGGIYGPMNGTSMATPHVSGLAALIKSAYPHLTNIEMRQKLVESAIDLGDGGRDTWYGYGLISAPMALADTGPDQKPPILSFNSLKDRNIISGIYPIDIYAVDLSGVPELKLLLDGQVLAQWNEPPYRYYLDTRALPIGLHTLALEAVDGAGNKGFYEQQIQVGLDIEILEPRPGTFIKDIISISGKISDNGQVAKIELFVDGELMETKVIEDDSGGLVDGLVQFKWDSRRITAMGNTVHAVKLVVMSTEGIITSAQVSVNLRNPVVQLINPVTDSVIEGILAISAHASDTSGIEKVEFYLDNHLIYTTTQRPYTFNYNTKELAAGKYSIQAAAYNRLGVKAISSPVVIGKPARIEFLSPQDGEIISGNYNVQIAVQEEIGIAELLLNKRSMGLRNGTGENLLKWQIETSIYEDLSVVEMELITYSYKGGVPSRAKINVTVDNYRDLVPPEVNIIAPTAGTILNTGTIELIASAKDEYSINYVEFFLDDQSVGLAVGYPYRYQMNTEQLSVGKHTIYARSEDIYGNLGTSPTIDIYQPTSINIIYPADNSRLKQGVTEFKFISNAKIKGAVSLYIDGKLEQALWVENPTTGPISIPYNWDVSQYPDLSQHEIHIEAYTEVDNVKSQGTAVVSIDSIILDNQPPSITLHANQQGITQGTVHLQVTAIDNTGIERTEYYCNGKLLLEQAYTDELFWDSSQVASGFYTVTAKVYDIHGNSSISNPVNLVVPTKVKITSPIVGSHVLGTLSSVTALFTDPVIGNVDLYIDNEYKATTLLNEPTTGPIQINYKWDTTQYQGISSHQILVVGRTLKDGIESKGETLVYIDNRSDSLAPKGVLSLSSLKAEVGDEVVLTVEAIDETGIGKVEIYQNNTLINTLEATPYRLSLFTQQLPVGRHEFKAKVYDRAGNTTESNTVNLALATKGQILNLTDGQQVTGIVNSFTAQFEHPIKGYVYLYINDQWRTSKFVGLTSEAVTLEYNWDTDELELGATAGVKVKAFTATGMILSEARVMVRKGV